MTGRTANHLIFVLCFTGGLAVSTDEAAAQIVPSGYTIPDITLSPDHRYGVTVPGLDTPNPHNSLIEIKTGRVLAVIQGHRLRASKSYQSCSFPLGQGQFISVVGSRGQMVRYGSGSFEIGKRESGVAA